MGTIVLNDFLEIPSYGVIVGLVCAVSEPFILGLVTENLNPDSTNEAIKTGVPSGTPGESGNQSAESNSPQDKPSGGEPPEDNPLEKQSETSSPKPE